MKTTLFAFSLLAAGSTLWAQQTRTVYAPDATTVPQLQHSVPQTLPCDGWADMQQTASNWRAGLYHLNHEHETPDYEIIEKIRKSYPPKVLSGVEENAGTDKTSATAPTLGTNFLGNELYGGTPPDNHAAVSNDGLIDRKSVV